MGKAAKALNKFSVFFGVVQRGRVIKTAIDEAYALILRLQVFGVHKRHVDKCSPVLRSFQIPAFINSALRHRQSFYVPGIGGFRAAIHIAGKLVENDNEREATLWRILPPLCI